MFLILILVLCTAAAGLHLWRRAALSLLEGWCLESLGKAQEAEAVYRRAINAGQPGRLLLGALARLLAARQGEGPVDADVVGIYRQAYRAGLYEDWLVSRLAVGLAFQKECTVEAAAVYRRVWAVAHVWATAEETSFMGRVVAGHLYRQGRPDEALPYLEDVRHGGESVSVSVTLGLAATYLLLERFGEAGELVGRIAARERDASLLLL